MKSIAIFSIAALSSGFFASCLTTDEVPPVQTKYASKYRLPDPQPLTNQDRALIDSLETEYENNTK